MPTSVVRRIPTVVTDMGLHDAAALAGSEAGNGKFGTALFSAR